MTGVAGAIDEWGTRQRVGAALAPLAFFGLWLAPLPLDAPAHRLSAVFAAVVILWVTEVLPIVVTALLIAPWMVMMGICDAKTAFAPYADPLLFLFVGGFMIAKAMTRHGLDRRIALGMVSLPFVGDRPARVRLAFLVTGAVLSMWISNTATTAILVPILIGLMGPQLDQGGDKERLATGSLLCVAYTCSIGGLGTPVGSPPNLIAMGFLNDAGYDFAFFDWVKVSLPTTLTILGVTYFMFTWLFPTRIVDEQGKMVELKFAPVHEPGTDGGFTPGRAWSTGEKVTMLAFGLAVVGWMLPGIFKLTDNAVLLEARKHMPGGAVAIVAASVLFMFRDGKERVLPWREGVQIDWGIIMLFGGGISMGRQLLETGLAEVLAKGIVEATGVENIWVLTALVTFFTIFFTEACSNTATSNMLSPLVVAVALQLGVSPVPPVLAVGLAASCAFMLPIATGPNAVVYGTGLIRVPAMMQAGFMLNLLCGVIIVACLRILCPIFGWV